MVDRSLKKLMMINRHMFINHHSIDPETVPDNNGSTVNELGENAINNHGTGNDYHSNKNQVIFNYVTRDFRDRCTSYESYLTAPYYGFAYNELEACEFLKADIVYTPFVNAAAWTNTDNENLILTVGSHYDNDGQGDVVIGTDNNRHDITANVTTFLSDSIAVSARRDTPELFKNSTSEGYGMEFFEDCSPEALNPYYPDKDIPTAFAEILTDDGITLYSTVHLTFTEYLTVGEKIIIRYGSDEASWEETYVNEIIDGNHIKVSSPVTILSTPSIYAYHDLRLGEYVTQQQSWAVPLVAGKLKVIKMSTNSDWDTVRAAARATAKRNSTGIAEIDNTNWDIYRGFGCIMVQDAIDYINNN